MRCRPRNLIERELFGPSESQAPPADVQAGLIHQAYGSTFMLDEVGESPADVQGRISRILEASVVRQQSLPPAFLGPSDLNVTIIATTSNPPNIRPELQHRFGPP